MTDVVTGQSVDELVRVLDLQRVGAGHWRGASMSRPQHRVYGGQLVAQAFLAVAREAADRLSSHAPHSVHCTFLAAAVPSATLEFHARPLREGRSFARYEVQATQGERPVGQVAVSFHRPETGYEHGTAALPSRPPEAGRPQGQFSDATSGGWLAGPVEVRELPPDGPAPDPVDPTELWLRVPRELPDDPVLHDAVLLYVSDLRMLRSLFRGHGVDRGHTRTASLDHAVWLHGRARVDDWIAYRTTSPWAGAGRGLGTGTLVAGTGELIATTAQEMLVRPGAGTSGAPRP